MDAKEFYSRGEEAARAGDRETARDLIARAVKADPELIQGWWALAHLVDDEKQKIYCLKQVIKIDPAHEKARTFLIKLAKKPESPPRPAERVQPVRTRRESVEQRASMPQRIPTPPPQQAQPSIEPSKPSRGRWIGVIAILCLLFVGVTVVFLMVAGLIPNPFTSSRTDLSSVVLPTLPAAWTETPMGTPQPMAESTPGIQQETPVPVEQTGYPIEVENALDLMHKDRLDAALDAWNAILKEDPEDHFSLAMRAHTRLRLVRNETSLTKYVNFSLGAITDADEAIALYPNMDGDYYVARAYGFENLSEVPGSRVDQDRFLELALENMLIGNALPHTNPTGYYGPPLYLLRLGRCDEALQQNLDLIEARGEEAAPVPNLHTRQAYAHFCKGEYEQALEQIAIAIDVYPSCSYYFTRALIYYHAGKVDQALNEINFTIDECPSGSGARYYLRALIHTERGNYDQAVQDLFLGSMNTWEQGGLKAYVEGLLALNVGDRTQAIESMKVAEQTIDRSHGPFIERIQVDLATLGVSPVVITPNPDPPSTPIPDLPDGHPTPPPETYVRYTTGTGMFRLEPGEIRYFHFFAPRGFEYERVSNLKVHLIGGNEGFSTDIELLLHNPLMAYWQPIDLIWGANEIQSEADYVNTSGDINIRLWNAGNEPVELEDFGISITVVASGGSRVRYTYLDEE